MCHASEAGQIQDAVEMLSAHLPGGRFGESPGAGSTLEVAGGRMTKIGSVAARGVFAAGGDEGPESLLSQLRIKF